MSHEDTIKTTLSNDATFNGYMTGGIYAFDATGRNGISRQSTAGAYGADGLLNPCCVVKERSSTPTGSIKDEAQGVTSYRSVVELWFYADGNDTVTTLGNAQARAKVLLDMTRITGTKVFWIGDLLNDREDVLENAHVRRSDYEIYGIQGG